VIDPAGIETTRTADHAVNFVALAKEKFSQIGAILTCDSSDQRSSRHRFPVVRMFADYTSAPAPDDGGLQSGFRNTNA
jgi:hypothetical protein